MKLKLNTPIKTISGAKIVMDDGKTPATLGHVAAVALCRHGVHGESADARDKRGKLARRIRKAQHIELTAEEIAVMKEAIGAWWQPDVVTPAFDLIEDRAGE